MRFRKGARLARGGFVSKPAQRLARKAGSFSRAIALEHSVFALPFAYLSALVAAGGWPGLATMFWITVAMVGARSFAMAVNRLADRDLDARNPRTRGRALVTGELGVGEFLAFTLVSLGVFLVAVYRLPRITHYLWPFALVPLAVYPYLKRFTWLTHLGLAVAQAVGPVGAWLAVTGSWSWTPVLLGAAVGIWVGGFDIIYSLQDLEVDRATGVHSIPARFGVGPALAVARGWHAVSLGLLSAFAWATGRGWIWWVGTAVVAAALAVEHSLVRPGDLSRVGAAFFTANGFIAVAMLVFGAADVFLGAGPG